MRTVRVVEGSEAGRAADVAVGDRYVLLKASGDAWLVRDPDTGTRRYLPADRLEYTDEPALSALAGSVSSPVRRVLTAVHDERSLGLLLEVVDRAATDDAAEPDATSVRTLLETTALCESDLHGSLGELRAAGLLERVEADTLGGGRAYRPTPTAVEAARRLRSA